MTYDSFAQQLGQRITAARADLPMITNGPRYEWRGARSTAALHESPGHKFCLRVFQHEDGLPVDGITDQPMDDLGLKLACDQIARLVH